ncbi:MAG TPA: enolase C-terminal domain-like protein [Candidatus Limnocylindrales bacterium]
MSAAERMPGGGRRQSKKSRIADVRSTTVTVPLEAPLRHAAGAHWGRFVRTIVEIETEGGVVGLGEMGGGGQSAELVVESLRPKLLGHDVFDATALWFKILNPTAALYDNRTQIHAALEFACLDAVGKILEVPVYDLLGGKMRDSVTFASYLFFRYPDPSSRSGEVRTVDQLVAQASDLKSRFGFRTHKLKAGVFGPDHELQAFLALSEAFPEDSLRIDPNASYSVRDAIRVGHAIKDLRNDYYEDPTWGMNGLRQVRQTVGLPIATNTVVTNLEQLAADVRDPAVDVILLDTTFWGGIRPVLKAAAVCETFQLGMGVHSSGELGIQLATMLHFGAALPTMDYAADAHYHHLTDDIIEGGLMPYRDGAIAVPDGPGLGVTLDPQRVKRYADLYRELGGYPYDRDPGRPDWYARVPNEEWADPTDASAPSLELPGKDGKP